MAKQENNWIPWVIVGGLAFYVFSQQPKEGGDPSTAAAVSAAKQTIPNIRAAYREAFLDAAKGIEDGTIANQEQWTKFIEDNAGAKRIEAMDKVYSAIDKLDLPVTFAGKEKELAKINREISEAW
jgi:hypothetical protein